MSCSQSILLVLHWFLLNSEFLPEFPSRFSNSNLSSNSSRLHNLNFFLNFSITQRKSLPTLEETWNINKANSLADINVSRPLKGSLHQSVIEYALPLIENSSWLFIPAFFTMHYETLLAVSFTSRNNRGERDGWSGS